MGSRVASGLQGQKLVPGTPCKPNFLVLTLFLNSRLGLGRDCHPGTWEVEMGREQQPVHTSPVV